MEFINQLYSPEGLSHMITVGGVWLVTGIIFAETGLLAGFFLPGDSLLITAGLFCSSTALGDRPPLDLPTLLISAGLAAIVGDQLGFYLGHKAGPKIYERPDSKFFKQKYLASARSFYETHGGKALIGARFIPIFRTFVPFFAGIAKMPYKDFVAYNVVGGVLWVGSMVLIGFFLGQTPLAQHLHKIIILVIAISLLPVALQLLKEFKKNRKGKSLVN